MTYIYHISMSYLDDYSNNDFLFVYRPVVLNLNTERPLSNKSVLMLHHLTINSLSVLNVILFYSLYTILLPSVRRSLRKIILSTSFWQYFCQLLLEDSSPNVTITLYVRWELWKMHTDKLNQLHFTCSTFSDWRNE